MSEVNVKSLYRVPEEIPGGKAKIVRIHFTNKIFYMLYALYLLKLEQLGFTHLSKAQVWL